MLKSAKILYDKICEDINNTDIRIDTLYFLMQSLYQNVQSLYYTAINDESFSSMTMEKDQEESSDEKE